MYPQLTDDENFALNHCSMWGSDGYPVQKVGRSWHVNGIRGAGRCPSTFKTKREAVAQWERYLDVLRDRVAGRL
jgi:hypothetical protein